MNMQVNPSDMKQDSSDWWAKDLNWQEWWTVTESDGTWRHPYKSPNLPEGYNTVVGFFYDWTPCDAACYDDEGGNAMLDQTLINIEDWCVEYAEAFGLTVHDVEAPEALKAHGIATLKAFPTDLLHIPVFEDLPK